MYETTRVGESPEEREKNEKRAKGWGPGKNNIEGAGEGKVFAKRASRKAGGELESLCH